MRPSRGTSQRVPEMSLPHRYLPQGDRKYVEVRVLFVISHQENFTSTWRKLWPESVVECDFEGFDPVAAEHAVNEIASLVKVM
ncbi:hypothetical protein AVEN_212410-1 [Araneus ventricosus]|uniref:Uncharacterized protein n=1 Tax=Araneus ventricosus TaxID=182803 RepID=A0A4Y2JEM5_ARAVE|nr:hypothetical protein AVEN_19495-1 [Araneus ventricosus]GBM88487.1 hypothetical protein AVEN_48004-1 [Araneus ventricosus]GBM88494.1 hypothetical protein AVEN_61298-1 [Araneus ventricosus]GBM88531.1 hypothetical protein AVEN_212410-1 [Araneus ventricosus]